MIFELFVIKPEFATCEKQKVKLSELIFCKSLTFYVQEGKSATKYVIRFLRIMYLLYVLS